MEKRINANLGLFLKDLRIQGLLTSHHGLSPDGNKAPHSVGVKYMRNQFIVISRAARTS